MAKVFNNRYDNISFGCRLFAPIENFPGPAVGLTNDVRVYLSMLTSHQSPVIFTLWTTSY